MQGILYEESSVLVYIFVTFVLGGGGAWMTGRACANTWRHEYILAFYTAILAVGIRFIHFSIFGATLLSAYYYIVDLIALEIIAFLGYRFTKTNLMVRQYYWLYRAAGPFAWTSRSGS